MFPYDSLVYIDGLSKATHYNNRVARVSEWNPRADGRIALQMLLGKAGLWAKPENLKPLKSVEDLKKEPFCRLSDDEKNDAGMYLFATEGASYIPGFKGVCIDTSAPSAEPKKKRVICARCKRHPEEIEEYLIAAKEEETTPTKYIKTGEGTYDDATGLFWCTDCYCILGCPTGKAYVIPDAPQETKLTEDLKAELLHAGQWGDRSSPQHWTALCRKIKKQYKGDYPSDWKEMVLMGKLFEDAGQVTRPGMRICSDQETAEFFGFA
jgi:hypothetical protein